MSDKIITGYKTVSSLKKRAIAFYVDFLKGRKELNKSILDRKDWASSGSEYHNNCRLEKIKEIIEIEKQIRQLKAN